MCSTHLPRDIVGCDLLVNMVIQRSMDLLVPVRCRDPEFLHLGLRDNSNAINLQRSAHPRFNVRNSDRPILKTKSIVFVVQFRLTSYMRPQSDYRVHFARLFQIAP